MLLWHRNKLPQKRNEGVSYISHALVGVLQFAAEVPDHGAAGRHGQGGHTALPVAERAARVCAGPGSPDQGAVLLQGLAPHQRLGVPARRGLFRPRLC